MLSLLHFLKSNCLCVLNVHHINVELFFPDSMPPSNDMTSQAQPYASHGYPSMQPAYQQGPTHTAPSPSHNLYGQSSYQQYSQVRLQLEVSTHLVSYLNFSFTSLEPGLKSLPTSSSAGHLAVQWFFLHKLNLTLEFS